MSRQQFSEVYYDKWRNACVHYLRNTPIVYQTNRGWRMDRKALEQIGGAACVNRVRSALVFAKANAINDPHKVATFVWRAVLLARIDTIGPEQYCYELARVLRRARYTTKAKMLEGEYEPRFNWKHTFSTEFPWVWGDSSDQDIERDERRARAMFLALAEHQYIPTAQTERDPW